MRYEILLLSLAVDLVAIILLTYGIYFRRHRRRDLTLGFMGVNVGLFAVASFVSSRPIGVGFGIGLFALLSVIRLRSTQMTQEEVGYYFVSVVIGLATGLSPDENWPTTITLAAVLVGVMYIADHPRMLARYSRRIVRLKSVYRDEGELRQVLQEKLGGEVMKVVVLDVDFLQKSTRVDVRFRPDPPGSHPRVKKAPKTPKTPHHADGAAPTVDDVDRTPFAPGGAIDVQVAEHADQEPPIEPDDDPGAQRC